ncbi:MAG: prefoldin subunit alpha [Thermoprotei archaeon]
MRSRGSYMSGTPTVQEKYALFQKLAGEYEYLGALAQTIEQQLRLIDAAQLELASTIGSLKELSERASGREALVPVGSGVMMQATLNSFDRLLVLLGQNVYAKMSPGQIEEYLNGRLKVMKAQSDELVGEYTKTVQRLQLLQPKIERLAQELQQAG